MISDKMQFYYSKIGNYNSDIFFFYLVFTFINLILGTEKYCTCFMIKAVLFCDLLISPI